MSVSRRTLPLVAEGDGNRVVAYRADGPVTVARFLDDVRHLAGRLPAGRQMLNVCQDRYRFMVGLAAGCVAGKLSLLPSAYTAQTVQELVADAPDLFCLTDGAAEAFGLPAVAYPADPAPAGHGAMPEIEADRPAVCLFTSGSTGRPTPHLRTWGSLVANGRAEAARLVDRGVAIVGTVPPQHSYGLESTVLLALCGPCAAWCGRPFYPADVAAALAAVPRPRMLVTTPVHLKSLLESGVALPAADLLLSATAPLPTDLARAAEERFAAPLFEIYGCTESGQLASRRTTAGAAWQPLADVVLEQDGDGVCHARGGHVAGRVPLSDVIELAADGRFLLHGRHADMVNIAGKRSSIAYLDHQLKSIPGVEDGCFFLPGEDAGAAVTRLCAFVVAPGLAAPTLLAALRQRLDPVFLPRPLVFVAELPRNATGKLPRASLQALLDSHRRAVT